MIKDYTLRKISILFLALFITFGCSSTTQINETTNTATITTRVELTPEVRTIIESKNSMISKLRLILSDVVVRETDVGIRVFIDNTQANHVLKYVSSIALFGEVYEPQTFSIKIGQSIEVLDSYSLVDLNDLTVILIPIRLHGSKEEALSPGTISLKSAKIIILP